MNKILIIGGTGTISLPLVKLLAEDPGNEVTVLNRGHNNALLPGNVQILTADLKNRFEEVKELLEGCFFHSVISFIIFDIEDARRHYELFKGHTEQFIFISTNCVLDHSVSCIVNEQSPCGNAYWPYGRNKQQCEQYFLSLPDFPVTIVRPTQTYSNDRIPLAYKGKTCWTVCSRLIQGKEVIVPGDGQSVWAGTHAEDFAEMFLPLVSNKNCLGEIYQIMNPEPYTWDMLYRALAGELGGTYRPVYISVDWLDPCRKYNWRETIHGDKHFSNLFDISKIKALRSDYVCRVSMTEGVKRYVSYMKEHPQLQKEDPEFDAWCDRIILKYHQLQNEFIKELDR